MTFIWLMMTKTTRRLLDSLGYINLDSARRLELSKMETPQ